MGDTLPVAIPVQKDSIDDTSRGIDAVVSHRHFEHFQDFVEVRLDSIRDLTPEGLTRLLTRYDGDVILTLRAINENGKRAWASPDLLNNWVAYEQARIDFYTQAIEAGVYSVDVEFSNAQRDVWDPFLETHGKKTFLTLSVHDFDRVPPRLGLDKLYDQMREFTAEKKLTAFLKFAYMLTCTDEQIEQGRAEKILQTGYSNLAHLAQRGREDHINYKDGKDGLFPICHSDASEDLTLAPLVIAVGMAGNATAGPFAENSRKKFGPEFETAWTFGCLDKSSQNAPGQPTLEDIKTYHRSL